MAIVRGNKYRKPIRQLLEKVVDKTGLTELNELDTNQLRRISREVAKVSSDHQEVAFSTLRDYRYKLNGQVNRPFSFSEEKLDLLCVYLGYLSWNSFLKDHPAEPESAPAEQPDSQVGNRQVFMCYHDADQKTAEMLFTRLEEQGISCWMRNQKLLIGENSLLRISEGIEKSQLVLHLVSNEANFSGTTRKEVTMAIQEELESHQVKVLPVLVAGSSMPYFLRDKHYADLTKGVEAGVQKIIHDVHERMGSTQSTGAMGTTRMEKEGPSAKAIHIGWITVWMLLLVLAGWWAVIYFNPSLSLPLRKLPVLSFIGMVVVFTYHLKARLINLQIARDANFAEDMGIFHLTHLLQNHYRKNLFRHSRKLMIKFVLFFELIGSLLTVLFLLSFVLFLRDLSYYLLT